MENSVALALGVQIDYEKLCTNRIYYKKKATEFCTEIRIVVSNLVVLTQIRCERACRAKLALLGCNSLL